MAERTLATMNEAQRVGQLFMIGTSSTDVPARTLAAIKRLHIGSVILDGTSYLSTSRTHAITSRLQAASHVPLFIATDQEGGEVQRLRGAGFTRIPSALDQGRINPTTLQRDANQWGRQLKVSGVNLNLAPVMDTVPSASAATNPPIGALDREYGHTPAAVTSHALAVLRGLTAAGIATTVKHFPGLGRVTANTDTTANVTDSVTTTTDPDLSPFRAAIGAGTPFVMVSSAVYTRIDPTRPAAFSSRVITRLLRADLGFSGVVISDDLGEAAQVASVPVGTRAVAFVAAGGDIVLSVVAQDIAPMVAAVAARASTDPTFRRLVDAAALRVLQAKQRYGLL